MTRLFIGNLTNRIFFFRLYQCESACLIVTVPEELLLAKCLLLLLAKTPVCVCVCIGVCMQVVCLSIARDPLSIIRSFPVIRKFSLNWSLNCLRQTLQTVWPNDFLKSQAKTSRILDWYLWLWWSVEQRKIK
jgi:hypothetical protein